MRNIKRVALRKPPSAATALSALLSASIASSVYAQTPAPADLNASQPAIAPSTQVGTQSARQAGTEFALQAGTQSAPQAGTQSAPQAGTESAPQVGTESAPQVGTESTQQAGTQSAQQAGTKSAPQVDAQPVPKTATQPETPRADEVQTVAPPSITEMHGVQSASSTHVHQKATAHNDRPRKHSKYRTALAPIDVPAALDPEQVEAPSDSTPTLFGGVRTNETNTRNENPIQFELSAATTDFYKELEKQRAMMDSSNKAEAMVEKDKFFGQPIIAQLDNIDDPKHDYYLVVLHFNIPTLNPSAAQTKYAFARFKAKFVGYRGDPTEDSKYFGNILARLKNNALRDRIQNQRAEELQPVTIVAVSPMHETLGVDRTNANVLTAQLRPTWFAASAGSVTDQVSKQDRYDFHLPTVLATGTRYGDATWSFYPARGQPLIAGTRTTMAVIAINKDAPSLEDMQREYEDLLQRDTDATDALQKAEESYVAAEAQYKEAMSSAAQDQFTKDRQVYLRHTMQSAADERVAMQSRKDECDRELAMAAARIKEQEISIKDKLESIDYRDPAQVDELTKMLCSRKLRVQGTFDYQLKSWHLMSGSQKKLLDTAVLDFDCMRLEDLIKLDSVDIPGDMVATIKSSFLRPKGEFTFSEGMSGKSDYMFDKASGRLFKVVNNSLIEVERKQ